MTSRLRRIAASSACLLLLAGVACSRDDDKGGARTLTSLSPSASLDPTASPTSSGASPSAGSSASAAGASAPTGASVSAAPSASPLRSAGTDPALEGGPGTLPPKQPYTPPAEGAYTFNNTGRSQISGCAVDDRPAPPTTGLQVSAVRGARQEAVRGDAEQGSQSTVVEYRDGGIFLVSLVIDQPGLGRIEFRPVNAVLLLPAPATQGKEWQFILRSTDGKYTIDSTSRITALRQPVRLGDGTTLSTTTVRTVSYLDGTSPIGTVDLDVTTVSSVAADPALAVKEVTDTDGTVGPCAFTGRVESLLKTIRPT